MAIASNWPTKSLSVATLHLDAKNPRLGRETTSRAPREIIQHLFEHDKAMEVAESIVYRGYFPNEPLLAIKENGRYVVVEGNRRLAALKVLREPGLLEGSLQRKAERLSRQISDPKLIAKVPVTIAPTRRATDQQIAGRHIGSPVLAWQAENRASFILDKLEEGYSNDDLRNTLGFSLADIQQARQTRAIADMARSLDLPEEVKAKLDNPRAKIFTTLERVFVSSVGREYLKVKPDPDHGLRGTTTKKEFLRGFTKLVTDVALGKQSSRSLNTNDNIRSYFDNWAPGERPKKKQGSFIPSDIISGRPVAPSSSKRKTTTPKRSKQASKTILPKDFKVHFGNDRLIDIRRELTKLKRDEYPNAGAVLLRVFFELAVQHYLDRAGKLPKIIEKLRSKGKLPPHGIPTMRQLVPEILKVARAQLSTRKAQLVEKAITYNSSAPFTISDLHAFVHSNDLPGARDIQQFWIRTEPLFRLMLEQDIKESQA
ncbi:MAG: ParB N-terminal domain-containing protein [Deltaproteobacteria bacterium]|nr:ParB N-terminal domain-containing protein [Deltaproteobacteria bacterium]